MKSSARLKFCTAACWWGLLAVANNDDEIELAELFEETHLSPPSLRGLQGMRALAGKNASLNWLKNHREGTMGSMVKEMQKELPKLFEQLGGKIANRTNVDLPADGDCAPAIKRFCTDTRPGNARVAHCVNDKAKAARARGEGKVLSMDCTKELGAILMLMSHIPRTNIKDNVTGIPVDLVPGFREACGADAAKQCSVNSTVVNVALGGYMACLQRLSYQDKLQPYCSKKMVEVQTMFSKNLLLDPHFYKACGPKLREIKECKELPFTPFIGKGEKAACLRRHRDELGENCTREINRIDRLQSKDVRMNAAVFSACKKELGSFCTDTQFGEARMIKCLWKNIDKDGFSESCRKEVKGETKLMMSNYTMDFRLANRCKKDIDSLCADAKTQVKESIGLEYQGLVIKCLKKNYVNITQPNCKTEVRRVVKIHATNPEMNPQWKVHCEADAKTHCANAERVHLCLRKKLDYISEGCKKVELLQGSLEARSIRLKPNMKKQCTVAIKQFCADVPEVDAQVIQCLQKKRDEKEFPNTCGKLVKEDFEASQHDLRLKFGVSDDCKDDAEEFCPDFIHYGGTDLISCMVSNMKQLKKPKCKKGIREHVQGASMNIKADPVTYAACVSDVEFLCPNVLPGQGRVHKCLLKNIDEVSSTCKREEFKKQQLLAADVTLSPLVMRECKTAITANCKDMQSDGAKLWECLEDLARKPIGSQKDLSSKCREEVVYHTRLKNTELHLNPELYEKCKPDFLKLCDEEMRIADEKAFTSYGFAIGCLIKKRATVKDDTCKAEMLRTMKQRVADIKANPQAHEYCRNDIETLCSGHKGPNALRQCLINRFKDLGEYCQDMIGEVMKMQSEDIRLQPGLQSACIREKKKLCSDVPEKPGLIQACLMKHLHHVDMQHDCKKKLEEKMATRSKSILLNPVLLRKCKGEFEKLRDKKLCKGLGLETGKVEDITTLNPAEILKKPELHGQIRQCLLKHRANISSTMCKAQLTVEMAAQSDDIRHNAVIFKKCKTDMEELCKDLQYGRGQGLKCLSDNILKIKNEKCKPLVAEMIKQQLQDATINPGIVRNCQLEQKAFCQGIEHGQARILKCLASNMNETSFGLNCRMAMFGIRAESLIKAKINDKMGYKEILKWLEINGTSGKGMLTGAIAGCLVAFALCSACFLAFKKGVFAKKGYAIVPRALDA